MEARAIACRPLAHRVSWRRVPFTESTHEASGSVDAAFPEQVALVLGPPVTTEKGGSAERTPR